MLNRTNKLLIGKDIDRTSTVASSSEMQTMVENAVDGELVVLDKNKKVFATGDTVGDTDTIFICQALSETYDFTNEAGTAVTGARRVVFSDPIQGSLVKNFRAVSYEAKAEQATIITPSGTVVEGTEYFIRIVYRDIPEHPGQFTHTYRVIANSTATTTALVTQLTAEINAHAGRRVTPTDSGGGALTLTGREVSGGTTSLSEVDEFKMVEFDAYSNYVDSNGNWQELAGTVTTTAAVFGSGNWEQIRDLEKAQLGNQGVYNKTFFPIVSPDLATVKEGFYDLIIIEHDKSYLSPDNQYVKQAPLTTVIALATATTGINAYNQAADVLAALNPWMASCPGQFANVSI